LEEEKEIRSVVRGVGVAANTGGSGVFPTNILILIPRGADRYMKRLLKAQPVQIVILEKVDHRFHKFCTVLRSRDRGAEIQRASPAADRNSGGYILYVLVYK
jgi:hypothetical protein